MYKKRSRGALLVCISVLLHGLLALLPWQEKSRPLAVSSTPSNPTPIIDVSQLPALPASDPEPLPVVPPALDTPIPETSDSPVDEPAPEVALTPDALILETSNSLIGGPAPETAPNANPTPVTTPAEQAKIAAAEWEHLVGYLESQDNGLDNSSPFQIFNLFGAPGQVNQFFDENDQPKFNILSFYLFPKQTPEQVRDMVMPELSSNTGFDPQLQENFPAGLAYQLLQGEMLRYLIIVKLDEGSGSFLILSESLPGLES